MLYGGGEFRLSVFLEMAGGIIYPQEVNAMWTTPRQNISIYDLANCRLYTGVTLSPGCCPGDIYEVIAHQMQAEGRKPWTWFRMISADLRYDIWGRKCDLAEYDIRDGDTICLMPWK